jgi:biotin carboxyl carrier protein
MVIVEAMKMENQVNSRAKGKVKAVNFSAGDQVDTETPIIELDIE